MHNGVSDRKNFRGLMFDYDIWKMFLRILGYKKCSFEDIIVIHDSLKDPFKQACRAFDQCASKSWNKPVYWLSFPIQISHVFSWH